MKAGWRRAVLAGAAALTLPGCLVGMPRARGLEDTAPSPAALWVPPPEPAAPHPGARAPAIPAGLEAREWTLGDVLDVALRNSPATRVTWLASVAALERYGVARAAYLPRVTLDGAAGAKNTYNSGSGDSTGQISYGPSVSLTWLLLDLGSRAGSLDAALQQLTAANWGHNRALQDLVLQVQRSYYDYVAAKALREARRASLRSADANLEAADRRHAAGVATIADVLQARTARAQAKLALQAVEGAILATRGSLAASMGLPADLSFDVAGVPRDLPTRGLERQVADLIGAALARRPDLAAARALAQASEAELASVRAEGLPTLNLSAAGGTTWFDVDGATSAGNGDRREDAWSAGLVLRYPLFTGFAQTHSEARARAEAAAVRERVRGLEQQAVLQVFTAYHALQTAAERVGAADELVTSAAQSEAVALARYREGVGTILDLLSAQSALAEARAQDVQSRWEWHTALALLAHDTGLLGLDGRTPLDPRDRQTNP